MLGRGAEDCPTLPFVKLLIDPILLLIPALILLHRRRVAAILVAIVLVLSMPIVAIGLERTLERAPRGEGEPEVIAVVSGGVAPSVDRVLTAAQWWRAHPGARLIIGGADTLAGGRLSTKNVELMRELAIVHGVDPAAIVLETRSRNTREHPIALLQIPGITPRTRVGLVTSAWHMRRAAASFRRRFAVVIEHAAPPSETTLSPLPSSDALAYSTTMLREWIGIIWYAVRG